MMTKLVAADRVSDERLIMLAARLGWWVMAAVADERGSSWLRTGGRLDWHQA